MNRNQSKHFVLVIWIVFGAAACLGAHIGPDGTNYMKSLNESQETAGNLNLSPTRFKIDLPKQPKSLQDYLHDISTRKVIDESLPQRTSDKESQKGKVVVVTRTHKNNKSNEEEWAIVAEPINSDLNENLKENESEDKYIEYNIEYLLDAEDNHRTDDFGNILFSFKDLVKMSTNPTMKEKINQGELPRQVQEKQFNVTYIMPIPAKNNKYFRIVVPNLTQLQYDEINTLLQEYMQNKSKAQVGNEASSTLNAANDNKKHLTSRSLTDSSLMYADFDEPKSTTRLPSNLSDALAFFERELTEKGYSPLLSSLSSDLPKHFSDKTESKEPDATLIVRNKGLSLEVATDYKQNNDQDSTLGNTKLEPSERSITSQRSQRPYNSQYYNSLKNRLRMRTSPPSIQVNENARMLNEDYPRKNLTGYTNQNASDPKKLLTNFDVMQADSLEPLRGQPINISHTQENNPERNLTNLKVTKNNQISDKLSELVKKHGNDEKSPLPINILQAANFIIDMKKKLEEDERKKNERYKNYIKSYLRGDDSMSPRESVNGSVMKIGKQEDNILEELKLLMLDYFTFFEFNLFDSLGTKNSSLPIETILNASDIYELMEQSKKLVKINLQYKLHNESREPTGFVKRIVQSQVDKCKELTSKLRQKVNNSSEPITRKTHKSYMLLSRCINLKLYKCVKGFSIWLQRGKFFLRPQFNLSRAYQNYEIEKNLYCLRTHNALTSESNARGIKVKSGLKVNRKTGMRRKITGGARAQNTRRRLRKGNKIRGQYKRKIQSPSSGKTSEDNPTATD